MKQALSVIRIQHWWRDLKKKKVSSRTLLLKEKLSFSIAHTSLAAAILPSSPTRALLPLQLARFHFVAPPHLQVVHKSHKRVLKAGVKFKGLVKTLQDQNEKAKLEVLWYSQLEAFTAALACQGAFVCVGWSSFGTSDLLHRRSPSPSTSLRVCVNGDDRQVRELELELRVTRKHADESARISSEHAEKMIQQQFAQLASVH